MSCNMKLDIYQNQLQLENSQAEHHHEIDAIVEEVFKSVTDLHDVNEDTSDDSSSSYGSPRREISVLHGPSEESKEKQYPPLFEEPDICTIPISTKKDENKEATPEVVQEKLPPSTATNKSVDEPKQCTKNENGTRKLSNASECKVTKPFSNATTKPVDEPKKCTKNDNALEKLSNAGDCNVAKPSSSPATKIVDASKQSTANNNVTQKISNNGEYIVNKENKVAKERDNLPNGSNLIKEKSQHEEIFNRPKLDEIFPNSVEESKMDVFCELPIAPTEKKVLGDEKVKSASLVPAKKAKVVAPASTCEEPPKTKTETTTSPTKKPEVEKSTTIPVPPPLPNFAKDLRDKTPPKKPSPSVNDTKQVKTENNASSSSSVKKEVNNADTKAKASTSTPSSSKNTVDDSAQERKISKQRPTAKPKSPTAVAQRVVPPKETMMAGGECFASVDGLEQGAINSAAASTSRRSSIHRNRETDLTKTTVSKHFNKLRNNKNWKKKHLVIAGGIGIAMVCFYAFYKTKT